MSLRYWNTKQERDTVTELLQCSACLLVSSPPLDYSNPEVTRSYLMDNDFNSLFLYNSIRLYQRISTPLEDTSIPFGAPDLEVEDISESDAIYYFRFRKQDLKGTTEALWPRLRLFLPEDSSKTRVICNNRYTCHYETGILMLLFRLSRPVRLRPEMERYFRSRNSRISAIIHTFLLALYRLSLPYLTTPRIWLPRMQYYSDLIYDKSNGAVQTVWSFIDGTLRPTCRPLYYQESAYSGHKRCHGLKFQSVGVPEGLIALLYGPIPGSRHDSFMLTDSALLPELQRIMPEDGSLGTVYRIYGDPAYPHSLHLFGGFRNPPRHSIQEAWNTEMSRVREMIEWLFGNVLEQFKFLDFRQSMKIFEQPIGLYYFVAVFILNLRVTIYGNNTARYFNARIEDRLSLAGYLNLVSIDELRAEADDYNL